MTKILCTFPGRAGDLLWALPTVRALSRRIGDPVDLATTEEFRPLLPLLKQQPYLRQVWAEPLWSLSKPEAWEPTWCPAHEERLTDYDQVLHLGYRRWPELALPYEVLWNLNNQWTDIPDPVFGTTAGVADSELDLQTPWITVPNADRSQFGGLTVGFAETHVELKMGLLFGLGNHWPTWINLLVMDGGRIDEEWMGPCAVDYNLIACASTWENAAWVIANADVFLGDCSGLHVLAVACGTPVVLYEPMEARHNPIFYPLGWDGPQVTRVIGNDGQWTTDSRHVKDALTARLACLTK